MRIRLFTILLILTAALAVVAERRKSDPGPHPIRLLKAIVENNGRDIGMSRGVVHLWVHNASDVAVDKCKVEVELFTRDNRLADKVTRDLGTIEPGNKKLQDIKWTIAGEEELKPRIWLLYNGGMDRLTQFEVETQNY